MSTTDHRTPDEIERDIDDTRAELDATLDALQERLNPQAAMDQAISYARQNGGLFGRNLMEQVRDNPLPALLAGIGLTWLMTARDSGPSAARIGQGFGTLRSGLAGGDGHAEGESHHDSSPGMRDRLHDASAGAKDRMHGARDSAGARMGAARDSIGSAASGMTARAGELYDRAGTGLRSAGGYARENPLMLGMAAAAFGVLAATMLPRTRTEEEAYEPLRERVRGAARDAGHRAVDQAEEQVHRATGKAEEKADQAADKAAGAAGGGGDSGGERDDRTAAGFGPGAARETSTTGLTDAERASRAQSVAGNASRPGPLPEDEGRPGREAGAAESGWVRPAGAAGDARPNPRPGLSGSQQGPGR
ncbi:DUF3618 domain-containing protein [Caenispirillum bisanense]|uniref:DUF3618 domain-containing protein n=1 Tax=Caenispirillum bisanense TaxID=414052 RepID=A0A286GH49_9PROT|nr:DUF3618 domain-containing protein [Caenispirillum bisanense]SOD94838.1 Protein of unknown function [Caenispirillum bisanense]